MCEVDVFEHHRFCDEFSHLVNACFVATRRTLLKTHFDGIDLLDVLNVLLNCQIHYIVVNNVFLQFNKCVK